VITLYIHANLVFKTNNYMSGHIFRDLLLFIRTNRISVSIIDRPSYSIKDTQRKPLENTEGAIKKV